MSSAVPVPNYTADFFYTQHLLRLQLNAPSLKISELSDINLKPIQAQFEKFVQTHNPANVVDVFIPVSDVPQKLTDVASYGIRVSPIDGLVFNLKNIKIDKSGAENEFYHAKIALGSVFNHQDPKAPIDKVQYLTTKLTKEGIPLDYNSARISENSYIIFGQNQINTVHHIKFVWDEKFETISPSRSTCDKCHNHNATIYCQNDRFKLCQRCDANQHKLQETKDHKRGPIEAGLLQNQDCPEHPGNPVQYYCPKCRLPICVTCKVQGTHARKEFSKHKLVPIDQAFRAGLMEATEPSTILTQRRNLLESEIKKKDDEIELIAKNLKETEDEIMRLAMKAIHEARALSSQQANLVKSAKLELIRKKDDLQKQETLLLKYVEDGEPVPVLQAIKDNIALEKSLKDNKDIPREIGPVGDLELYGQLVVKPREIPKKFGSSVVSNREVPQAFSDDETAEEEEEDEDSMPHISSLQKIAQRKQAKFDKSGVKIDFVPFQDSEILETDEQKRVLYLCLPFKAVPEPHILYSSSIHGKTMKALHENVDNVGITCVIVKYGKNIFGGFAGSKWVPDGNAKRDKSSTFLFQLTKDAYVPFGGQSEDKLYMVATEDYISFGGEDLKINGQQLENCSSAIENSFGVGLKYGSKAAKEFLAGKHQFKPDCVEIWGFFSPN